MAFHSSPKAKEDHESWESLFRRTLSKERLFTSTRPAENPIHWIQLLDSFNQHDTRKMCKSTAATHSDLAGNGGLPRSGDLSAHKSLQSKLPEAVAALAQAACKVSGESRFSGSIDVPGWPLIPLSKVQTIKCEKCCLEFCSPINHRRHLRAIHRRTSYAEKEDLQSQRQQFATFWDKLSPEEAYTIAGVKTLQVEDLTGEKVAKALSHLLQQPSLFQLPHSYVKSGAMLLELVQSKLSRIFLTSSELFKILDGSSEKTFPSLGLSAMQKYVFEGGAGKIGLETKNLVASLSFLVEHNLVKAFIKNKDEEAWRCQTALVEEEEASQRKQAQIQARKDMKKVRQKDKELKASAVAACRRLDIDLSDDEPSSSCLSAGSQTMPSSNTFENLNHQLAGEGLNFKNYEDNVSFAVSSPSEKNLVEEESKDEVVLTTVLTSCEKGLDDGDLKDVARVADDGDLKDVARVADDVGRMSKALEVKTVDTSKLFGTDTGCFKDASDAQRPFTLQKGKHLGECKFSVRRDASCFSYQKQFWKERRSLNAVSNSKQTPATEFEKDMGLSSSCLLEATSRDAFVDEVVGIRPKQHVAKPLRLRNYQSAAKVGAPVWTKKIGKCGNTLPVKVPHCPDLASDTHEVSEADHALILDSSVGVSSTAAPRDHKLDSLFISSTTMCSNGESSHCAASSKEQFTSKACSLSDEGSQAALFEADFGHYQGGASIAPVVIGSVVIGSLDISLESVIGQKESALTASSWKESVKASGMVDVSEIQLDEPGCPIETLKEMSKEVSENGKSNCESLKACKRDENCSKECLQSGAERKENKEHSVYLAGTGNYMKPSVEQGVSVVKTQVWRPVAVNIHRDCCVDEISSLDVNSPDPGKKVKVLLNHSLVTGGGINNLDLKELESDQTSQENRHINPLTSGQTKAVMEGGTAYEADRTTTVRALASFLSKRWSDALCSSDSVIFSAEAEEPKGGARQLGINNVNFQRRGFDMDFEDSGNPAPHFHKGATSSPAHAASAYGLWKHGCSGSAMAVNRRMMGKENSHFASRYASYRYIRK